jgi:glycerate 2-kinase
VTTGILNVLKGTESDYHLEKIRLNGASHPTPGKDGVRGVEEMLTLMEGAGEEDLFIVLISGGGSSLMTYPARNVSLSDIRGLTVRLLRSGATINELNAVRKHLSAIKGGLMAKGAHPATVLSLVLSDVVGDPLDTIASGPTSPDHTTFEDAIGVLKKREIWDETSPSVRRHLEKGLGGEVEETPKAGDMIFDRVHNVVIGSNLTASRAALGRAEELGYHSLLWSTSVEGEAKEVGMALADIAKEIVAADTPVKRPAALIAGGETTVTVTGNGVGGRNQELALSASIEVSGFDVVVAALATDGIDGPTDVAGAIVDGSTLKRAETMNMDALQLLADNDSYTFFSRLGDALFTGPTGTNVNDLTLILVPS